MQTYTLPDGRSIRVGAERFMAPEALLRPALLGQEGPGIPEMVLNCIQVPHACCSLFHPGNNRRCLIEFHCSI